MILCEESQPLKEYKIQIVCSRAQTTLSVQRHAASIFTLIFSGVRADDTKFANTNTMCASLENAINFSINVNELHFVESRRSMEPDAIGAPLTSHSISIMCEKFNAQFFGKQQWLARSAPDSHKQFRARVIQTALCSNVNENLIRRRTTCALLYG